jgi:hypothetical protein
MKRTAPITLSQQRAHRFYCVGCVSGPANCRFRDTCSSNNWCSLVKQRLNRCLHARDSFATRYILFLTAVVIIPHLNLCLQHLTSSVNMWQYESNWSTVCRDSHSHAPKVFHFSVTPENKFRYRGHPHFRQNCNICIWLYVCLSPSLSPVAHFGV